MLTATRVKRNKRDRGFTKVTRVPTRFRPADTVSRRARGLLQDQEGLTSPFELDVQGDQSPTTFLTEEINQVEDWGDQEVVYLPEIQMDYQLMMEYQEEIEGHQFITNTKYSTK